MNKDFEAALPKILEEEAEYIFAELEDRGLYTHENFLIAMTEKYKISGRYRERAGCIFYTKRYTRNYRKAYELSLMALNDRSWIVRYHACMGLALSLNQDALRYLHKAKETFKEHEETLDHISRAIDAIEHQNHHYFVDKEHSGRSTLSIDIVD